MLIWRMPSNTLIRSRAHVPQLFEPDFPYEEDTCFNCGGTCFIEKGGSEFGHERVRCPVCGAVGETFVAYPPYDYYEWLELEVPGVDIMLFFDGQINWHP